MSQIRYAFIIFVLTLLSAQSLAQEGAAGEKASEERTFILQEIPSSLEEMLLAAFRSNPDILVAQADLYQAQAKVKQVRLKVARAVVEAHQQRKTILANLEIARSRFADMQSLVETGRAKASELDGHRQQMLSAEGALAETEAMIREIIGQDPSSGETPDSLEEMLAVALDANGEIALARADLVRMDARSNQVRLQMTEDVTIAHQMRRVKKNALVTAESFMQKMQERLEQGLVSREETLPAFQAVIEAEAELIRIEARIRYLLGLGGTVQVKTK